MAVLQTIRSLFVPVSPAAPETVIPAAPTEYQVHPLTTDQVKELVRLNVRCFTNGDSYTKHTFTYLLGEPNTISYRMVTAEGEIAGFVFVMVNQNGAAHLTTIGVAPEHRRRGVAWRLLDHVESALRKREVGTLMLEVRVGNTAAQDLYRRAGYRVAQRINRYYTNGEDCFLMIKSLD